MALRKAWKDLDRSTVGSAPDAYGLVEYGDGEGNLLGADAGFLPDLLREELAYGDAEKVRWERAQSKDHAERLLDER